MGSITPHIVAAPTDELDAVIEAGLRRYFEAEDRMFEEMRARLRSSTDDA